MVDFAVAAKLLLVVLRGFKGSHVAQRSGGAEESNNPTALVGLSNYLVDGPTMTNLGHEVKYDLATSTPMS